MPATFIGIDLAWQSERNPSGAAVLHGDALAAELVAVADPLRSIAQVKAWTASHIEATTVIAIDAPLIIGNIVSLRGCERDIGVRYGARHASCHASNLTLYPEAASVALASWLGNQGFVHAAVGFGNRSMLEVYPHAAFVALFDLPTIIKYKKGRVAQKCAGLRQVQATLRRLCAESVALRSTPLLEEILSQDPAVLRGRARKSYEDSLDAIFCAYLAYYSWRLKGDGSEVFGSHETGYIVNPRLRQATDRVAAS